MKSWISFVVRFRFAVVLLCALLTRWFATQIAKLQILINSDNFIPRSNHYALVGTEIERVFGNKNTVVIGLTANGGSIYQPAILEKVRRITARLMTSPGVVKSNVLRLSARKAKAITGVADGMEARPLMEAMPTTPQAIVLLRHDIASNAAYQNILVSADGDWLRSPPP